MNSAKLLAYFWVGLLGLLNILQIVAPILPKEWGDVVTAVLALLATYHIGQSHSPAALGAAGYTKNY